ncbi:hypothetical protein BJ944DRAFT_262866 [Cunninghamella echinulata]|nr:hypothetical protein BJ944DRAFT_262866 [Cunninghamella echinulata]
MNKINLLLQIFLLFTYIYLIQCQNPGFDTTIDQYANINKINNDAGNGFSVLYNNWYKIIHNQKTNQSYVVTFQGQKPPTLTEPFANAIYVNTTDIQSIGIMNANVAIPYLELLELNNKVTYTNDKESITSNCMASLAPTNTASLVISNSTFVGNNITTISFSPDDSMTPIQKSSWLVYLSYFFDKEQDAINRLQNIQSIYYCHKDNLAKAGAQSIAFVRYENNAWSVETSYYYQTLVTEAGMTLYNGSHHTLHEAQFIVDLSSPKTGITYSAWQAALTYVDPDATSFIQSKNIYRIDRLVNAAGFPDWTERASVRSDLMIQDIIHMVYSTYQPSYPSTWLRNYIKNDPTKLTNEPNNYPVCTDISSQFHESKCEFNRFDPKDPSTGSSGQGSSSPNNGNGLSIGGKIGVALGVIVIVVILTIGGFFYYQRKKSAPTHTFYKMNDI